ncbi:PolC-type DNA polymerase III domain-containing protein, partial [Herbiconiux daphne]
MRIFLTDIETNGFYFEVSIFHCAWIIDLATGKRKGFRPNQFKEYLATLAKADVVVYHNGIDYDLPVLAKLAGVDLTFNVFDTLVLSRILDPDKQGGHSLKAWGI